MFGFCFDDDDESAVFFKKVVDRTRRYCTFPHVTCFVFLYKQRPLAVFRPFRSNSVKKEKIKIKTNTSSSPLAPPPSKPVKTSLISGPAPHSFVHVSHVGVNTRGIVESSKNIEPAWGALIADLQGYGISPEVMGNNMGFIKELVTGVAAAESALPCTSFVPLAFVCCHCDAWILTCLCDSISYTFITHARQSTPGKEAQDPSQGSDPLKRSITLVVFAHVQDRVHLSVGLYFFDSKIYPFHSYSAIV